MRARCTMLIRGVTRYICRCRANFGIENMSSCKRSISASIVQAWDAGEVEIGRIIEIVHEVVRSRKLEVATAKR